MSWKKNCEIKSSKKDNEKESERKKEIEQKKESEKKKEIEKKRQSQENERKTKKQSSFYAKASDVKSAFDTNQPIFVLLYKEVCFNTN